MIDFLIVGAEKSGTTWLYDNLKQIDNIYLPDTKEVNYFNKYNSFLELNPGYQKNLSWYMQFFKNRKDHQLAGEASPMYLCDSQAYKEIYKVNPEVKLIVMLRNPIYRAYSHYWYIRRKGYIDGEFSQYVKNQDKKIIERGLYASQLKNYYKLFPDNNILVLDFDMISSNPKGLIEEVLEFLNINNGKVDESNLYKKSNQSFTVKNKFIYDNTRRLASFFRFKTKLGFLNDIARNIGLRKLLVDNMKQTQDYTNIKKVDYRSLMEFYREDILELNNLTNKNFNKWLDR
ncbi:sulfotransferase domain-containing protein [Virgibacillus salinus]|uniref:Sulfotransferase domain-containing protein n=1 Tax=Virgibacillus salinus TaxID=553311 RepID=A0A1H0YIA6_9BACI|nr:sulfotransferase domain-containing protein [Virgibacillus salinus]SDQ14902.1 Sulfotransferase domain-containing protein [Virgibacillus salinus]